MKVRSVLLASVCTALLAASAAVPVAAAATPQDALAASKQAYKALVSGRALDAVKLYSEAIESETLKSDQLLHALLNRALAYQNLGQANEAIDDYSAAMRLDALGPKLRAVALYNRGLAHQKARNPAMAIEDFTNALFLDVRFSQAYYSRGNVLRRSGQYLFALSDYEKAIKYSHPEPHLPLYGTALTYEALRRPKEAEKALVQALTLKPDFAAAREKLTSLIQPAGDRPADGSASKNSAAVIVPGASKLAGSDRMVTGSLGQNNPDLVQRKASLPAPVSPPASVQQAAGVVPASAEASQSPAMPDVPAPTHIIAAAQSSAETKLEAPAAPEATQRPQPTGWAVQISSQKQEDAAWSVWKKMQAKHKRLLSSRDADVFKADLGDKGIFYRLRVTGIDNRKDAKRLCSRLKRRGTSCFVARLES